MYEKKVQTLQNHRRKHMHGVGSNHSVSQRSSGSPYHAAIFRCDQRHREQKPAGQASLSYTLAKAKRPLTCLACSTGVSAVVVGHVEERLQKCRKVCVSSTRKIHPWFTLEVSAIEICQKESRISRHASALSYRCGFDLENVVRH